MLAKVLPFPESWTAEQRRRTAILLLDMAGIPVGFGLAVLLRFRDNDSQLRALARQIGLRLGVTGTGGTLLTGALAATRALDDRVQAGGRLARFPVGVPVGLMIAVVVERLRQRDDPPEHAADPASATRSSTSNGRDSTLCTPSRPARGPNRGHLGRRPVSQIAWSARFRRR